MRRLFLASYFAEIAKSLTDFAGDELAGKHVAFIPTASVVEKMAFYVKEDKQALEKLGLVVDELEISTATPQEIKDTIANSDICFVTGGNVFFLLQELKRTGADELLIEQINKGKLYIGSSAGSAITCPDIEYLKYMDNPAKAPNLEGDYSAMSIVDFHVVPHATNFPFKGSAKRVIDEYSGKLDLRVISNNQVITIQGDEERTLTVEKSPRFGRKSERFGK